MAKAQLDLFGAGGGQQDIDVTVSHEPPPADFIARIRTELETTLAMARKAEALPWRDLTQTTLAELRFNSIANWLPADEANTLRAAFDIEMTRLYDLEDRRAEEAAMAMELPVAAR